MRNRLFRITQSSEDGTISSIVLNEDRYNMNWCSGIVGWGEMRVNDDTPFIDNAGMQSIIGTQNLPCVSFTEKENASISIYRNKDLNLTVLRDFDDDGFLNERYTIKNMRDADMFLEQGDIGIALPFNDIYTDADDCMVRRCNTHIWCGGNTSYISAVKMGKSDFNIGLALTEGAFASYSMCHANTYNNRGVFIMDCEHLELLPGEEYSWSLKLFPFKNHEEFNRIIESYRNTVCIKAEKYTVFGSEPIKCSIILSFKPEKIKALIDEKEIPITERNGRYFIEYLPERFGDIRLTVLADDIHTYAEFYRSTKPHELIKKRLYFIAEKQQYKRQDSALYGAYLAYDNYKKYPVFSSETRDHNACRERVGMALLMCRYLQKNNDFFLRNSLDMFMEFAKREFYDTETGEVFDGIGKNRDFIRLYNAPWMIMLFTEMYNLTSDKEYLEYCLKSIDFYYSGGGYKFYPNAFSMLLTYNAFKKAGMANECKTVYEHFKRHADNIVKNGLSYPKHEVNYEQTIVSPAVSILSDFSVISGKKIYAIEAQKHIEPLQRFNGHQPSCHMNEIPIRYWDDFWFGEGRQQGDTFPHYWSCLTARAYYDYYNICGDKKYKLAANECIRNCFCLFNKQGEGSCAYIYPYKVNGNKGEFYDRWSNDQDFALYYYLTINE